MEWDLGLNAESAFEECIYTERLNKLENIGLDGMQRRQRA